MNRQIDTYINNNDNYNEVSLTLLIWGLSSKTWILILLFSLLSDYINGRYVMYI